jgi:hypothetical protein
MVQKVQVYIYDLSRGMAKSLGPAIIGRYRYRAVSFTSVVGTQFYQKL